MRPAPRLEISLLAFTAAIVAAAEWSAHIGRKVWSPSVFAWRNFLKPQPHIEEQFDCPVRLIHPRFYSFMSKGSAIGSVLKLEVKNVSKRPIHSFTISYFSPEPADTGSIGVQPEKLLLPEKAEAVTVSSNGKSSVTFAVDFVQFTDGDVWYADPPRATVKPEGVRAGAQAAHQYLFEALDSGGPSAVLAALPRIRLEVESPEYLMDEVYGLHGFYCGVTNTVVRIEHAYGEGLLSGVEKFLRQQSG